MENKRQKPRVLATSSMLGQSKGQVTIFIILAVLIIGAVAAYFILSGDVGISEIPANMQPIYTSFLSCLEEDALTGIGLLESQAGYISLPDFEPGSDYMPFSSQLNFLGNPIPYWYYVSGNNIQKEQLPSKSEMEEDLEEFIESRVRNCEFETYYDQGFEVEQGEPGASVNIKNSEVEVDLDMNFAISLEDESVVVKDHLVSVDSKLGSLYDSAREVYEVEQESLFLEERAVDILRLYAPVDGVELTCSPLIWDANNVFDELEEAIEANTLAIGVSGDDYFDPDVSVGGEVRFLNSRYWPHSFEVNPSEESLLLANPVGNQPGLGALGFCYVPYHFVYNVRYPVLVQVQEGEEIFQFPLAVVLQNNNPREALEADAIESAVPELCQYKNTVSRVNTYDTDLNPIDAQISYECFGTKCNIGTTSSGFLQEEFPQCVNGYVIARAEGYEDARYLYSTVSEGSISIYLDRLYTKEVNLKLDNTNYNREAIIQFISNDISKTINYPDQRSVELGEGQYEIYVYIYEESSIHIGATTTEECIDVPRGVIGVLGFTKERCFDIEIPEQIISNALVGGGVTSYYFLESELSSSSSIELNTRSLPSPETIEQVQDNHVLFEENKLEISLA
jgi:hypothetical protein